MADLQLAMIQLVATALTLRRGRGTANGKERTCAVLGSGLSPSPCADRCPARTSLWPLGRRAAFGEPAARPPGSRGARESALLRRCRGFGKPIVFTSIPSRGIEDAAVGGAIPRQSRLQAARGKRNRQVRRLSCDFDPPQYALGELELELRCVRYAYRD